MTREKMLWFPSRGYFHQVEQTCSHTNTKKLGEFFSSKLRTNMMAADASAASEYFLFGKKFWLWCWRKCLSVGILSRCARFGSCDGLRLSELLSSYSCWALGFFQITSNGKRHTLPSSFQRLIIFDHCKILSDHPSSDPARWGINLERTYVTVGSCLKMLIYYIY